MKTLMSLFFITLALSNTTANATELFTENGEEIQQVVAQSDDEVVIDEAPTPISDDEITIDSSGDE